MSFNISRFRKAKRDLGRGCLRLMTISLVLLLCGCGPMIAPPHGMVERRPASQVGAFEASTDVIDGSKSLAGLRYRLELLTASEVSLCKGVFAAHLYADFTLRFEDSQINCGSFLIDVNSLLGTINLLSSLDSVTSKDASGAQTELPVSLIHDGKILYLGALEKNLTFEPPRPVLIGPLIFDHSKFKGLKTSVTTKVSINEPDFVGSDTGTYTAEVLEVDQVFKNEAISSGLNHTIHWQIITEGLQNLPDKYGMFMPKFELWWNSAPIMIPRVRLELNGRSLIAQIDELGNAEKVTNLVGNLTIDINLESYHLQ